MCTMYMLGILFTDSIKYLFQAVKNKINVGRLFVFKCLISVVNVKNEFKEKMLIKGSLPRKF